MYRLLAHDQGVERFRGRFWKGVDNPNVPAEIVCVSCPEAHLPWTLVAGELEFEFDHATTQSESSRSRKKKNKYVLGGAHPHTHTRS